MTSISERVARGVEWGHHRAAGGGAVMAELDLDAIRRRLNHYNQYTGTEAHFASAADFLCKSVPALIAEVERLRHEVFTLTNSEDAQVFIAEQERDAAILEAERLKSESYVCPQCGPDPAGSDRHALTHHTWPPEVSDAP